MHADISIFDPSHNLFVSSKIGTKTVDLWPDETLFSEFHSVSSGDLLDFTLRVVFWVDFDSSLGTTERYISDCELESHK